MSNWIQIKKEDIRVDDDEIDFYVNSDDYGNNYGCIKIGVLKQILEEYDTKRNNHPSLKTI